MKRRPEGAWERAMKVQEVILRAMAQRITWWRQRKQRYETYSYDGLLDRRWRHRPPLAAFIQTFREQVSGGDGRMKELVRAGSL